MFTENPQNGQKQVTQRLTMQVGSTKLMSPERLSELIGVSIPTLANWRAQGIGPQFIKLGRRRICYLETDVEAWVKSRVFQNTLEAQIAR